MPAESARVLLMTKTAASQVPNLFPSIAAAKAELDALRSNAPLNCSPEYKSYVEQSKVLQAKLREESKVLKGIVCTPCGGTGIVHLGYNQDSVERCGKCPGDGWTAKGRKRYAK